MRQNPDISSDRMFSIFISYRRDDTSGHAGHLYALLSKEFPGHVFMDIDKIEPGQDFVKAISDAVGKSSVLIVLIGKEWLSITDSAGHRRLDNPEDLVHVEVAAALSRDIRVIPVLVEGASMPRPEDLPEELRGLARRNAIEISDARWEHDVERLVRVLEKDIPKHKSKRGALVATIITSLIVLVTIAAYFYVAGKGKVLLRETFEDNSNRWAIARDGQLYNAYLEDGKYVMEVKNDLTSTEVMPKTFQVPENFDLEVTTIWKDGVIDQGYGLVLGLDRNTRYAFDVSGNGQAMAQFFKEGEPVISSISWQPGSAREGDGSSENRLKIEVRGKKISYYVNDKHIGDIPKANVIEEWAAVGVTVGGKQKVAFDDLILTAR
jgi:hypothetical protein